MSVRCLPVSAYAFPAMKPGQPEATTPLAGNAATTPVPGSQPSTTDSQPPPVPDHELLRRIGTGSYGEVWLARSALGTLRAVKVVHRASFDHDQPFEREFKGIQKFEPVSRSHEGLVDILQVGRNDAEGCFYYVMELADDGSESRLQPEEVPKVSRRNNDATPDRLKAGLQTYLSRTLRADLKRRARLPVSECLDIGLALASALAHLHKNGLVHRDIKPSNIIFVGGAPKLADIGLVADISEARSFVGTTGFIPPEGPGTAQADLYSLGKVLYEISTGHDRQDFPALPPNLRELPDADALIEFNEIVVKACAPDLRQRYQSAQEMAADLALLQEGKSVRRTRVHQRLWSQVKKAALGLVLLALVIAGVARVARQTQRNEAAEGGPPSKNELANALCDKALRNLRGDNQRGFPEVYTNLHRAIDLDPHFARPYVGLLELVRREHLTGVKYLPEDNERSYTQRLVELAPESAAAQCGEAGIAFFDWDFPAAERHVRRAIRIDPDYEFPHTTYGYMLNCWGRPVEARRELEIARRLNPSKVQIHRTLAHSYYVERDFPRAIEMYRAAINWQPRDLPAQECLGRAYRALGDYEKAIDRFEAMESLESGKTPQVAARFDWLRQAFRENGARGYWQEEWNQAPTNGFYQRARILARLGDTDTDGVFNLLNQAYQAHERDGPVQDWLTSLVFDEVWDSFRHDPRFQEMLDKIGFTKVNPKLRE